MTRLSSVSPHPLVQSLVAAVGATMPVARALGERLAEVPPISKLDGSPVTVAGYVVQALLVHALREMAPGVGFICEESSAGLRAADRSDVVELFVHEVRGALGEMSREQALALLDPAPPSSADWWLLDPIDGTAGFIAGAHFSVCVARVTDGRAVLSAIGCPRLAEERSTHVARQGPGRVVAAQRGGGAWSWFEHAGQDLRALQRLGWHQPLRWARSVNRRKLPVRAQGAFDSLGVPLESIHIDSQCKYALIASGQADAAVRLPGRRGPEHAWDHVAGALAVSEAGFVATDVFGQSLDPKYGAELRANRGVLCAPPELHARMVTALSALVGEEQA